MQKHTFALIFAAFIVMSGIGSANAETGLTLKKENMQSRSLTLPGVKYGKWCIQVGSVESGVGLYECESCSSDGTVCKITLEELDTSF